jgi:hypothetical protein
MKTILFILMLLSVSPTVQAQSPKAIQAAIEQAETRGSDNAEQYFKSRTRDEVVHALKYGINAAGDSIDKGKAESYYTNPYLIEIYRMAFYGHIEDLLHYGLNDHADHHWDPCP